MWQAGGGLRVTCYFCCFYRTGDRWNEEEEEAAVHTYEPIAVSVEQEARLEWVFKQGLDLRRIKSLLHNIVTCNHHTMPAVEQLVWCEIDSIVDATDDLNREIKETLKALYRIEDPVQREHCAERVGFLLVRYEQTMRYTADSASGDTFHSIIEDVRGAKQYLL